MLDLQPTAAGIDSVCERVAHELQLLQDLSASVESSLCACVQSSALHDQHIRDLQKLDALMQGLAALRGFLVALPDGASQASTFDLSGPLATISLEEIKSRLAGGGPTVSAATVEFF